MSLKQLINALFKLSGGQAMPVTTSGIVEISGTTYVAPSAGYLHYTRLSNGRGYIRINVNGVINQVTYGSEQNGYKSLYIPVNKGDNLTDISGSTTDTEILSESKQFIKLVGGAKSLLSQAVRCVRGGVLCLLTSSIQSARYLSCLVRKRFQQTKTGLFLQTHKRMVLTPHPVMGISASITTILAPASSICIQMQKKTLDELRRSNTLAGIAQAQQFLLKKAMLSNGYRTLRLLKCGSFPQLDRNSLNDKEVCYA